MASLFLLLAPLTAAAQQTVTKAQLRSQDPRMTERQLKDQLWSIFTPVDERRPADHPAPRTALDNGWLYSRSYAADVPGLCRVDAVTLRFAPVGARKNGARAPVRAYGVDAVPMYHFRKPPAGWHQDRDNDERSPWDGECEGLDLRKENFFSAPNDWMAADGYYAMLLGARASAEGKVRPRCDIGPQGQKSCADYVADFAKAAVRNIERCEPIPSRICYEITDSRDMKLRVAFGTANEVRSIDLEQMVVLRDERID